MSLESVRVVLVRPHYPGNLGAVARVMHNFGLRDLALVGPLADPRDREARRLSTQGEFILDRARTCRDLGEAVADCRRVVATSASAAGLFRARSAGTPEEVLPDLLAEVPPGPVALVFGPEPSGLTNAEIARCDALLHIPAADHYPALNLAQAVAICLYELFRHARLREGPAPAAEPVAPFADQEQAFAALREALEEVHFLYGPKADALMHALRHLIGRARPTAQEVKLLHGLARQLRWFARHGKGAAPEESA